MVAGVICATGVLPPLLACLQWMVREAQEESPHLPLASLLKSQQRMLVFLHDLVARGPTCAALMAEAGADSVLQAILDARKVQSIWLGAAGWGPRKNGICCRFQIPDFTSAHAPNHQQRR